MKLMYVNPESPHTNVPEHCNLHHGYRLGHPQFKISFIWKFYELNLLNISSLLILGHSQNPAFQSPQFMWCTIWRKTPSFQIFNIWHIWPSMYEHNLLTHQEISNLLLGYKITLPK